MITRTTVATAIQDVIKNVKKSEVDEIVAILFDKPLAAEPKLPTHLKPKYKVEAISIRYPAEPAKPELKVVPASVRL